jgi:hypothetical protein
MERKFILKKVVGIERLAKNQKVFDKYANDIAEGHSKSVVMEMATWPKSESSPITYKQLLNVGLTFGERIVYDDDKYLLTSDESFITLYKYVEPGEDDYNELRRLVSTMTYYEALDHLKGYNVSKDFENEYFDCNYKGITATILKENRYGGCIVSPSIEYWIAGVSEPIRVLISK